MNIKTVAICGGGTMGRGIAQVAAKAGFLTVLYELNSAVLRNTKEEMNKTLQSLLDKGKIGASEKEGILNKITFTDDINDCRADLLIEAIIEDPSKKVALFRELVRINSDETILATNTSSLSVSGLASKLERPEKFIGLHFFNPAPIMKLVEVVFIDTTDEGIKKTAVDFCKRLGKTPVICKDAPGFIVNRVARPYYIESLRIAEESEPNPDYAQIDRVLEATGFKMGPFKLMDLIGNDINLSVSESVYQQLGDPGRLKPSYLQEQKVKAGELGKKTGKGYYEYID